MSKQQIRRYERLYRGDPDPLRATLPPPDYVPVWKTAWVHRRPVALVLLLMLLAAGPLFLVLKPAVVAGGLHGRSGSAFKTSAIVFQETAIENRMPFDVRVTRIETFGKIEWMSPPGFEVRIGSAYEVGNPETLPVFKPFTLKAHQMVAVYLMARMQCPDRVLPYSENSFGASALSSFKVHYRVFGLPFTTNLRTSGPDSGFIEPTSKDCPESKPLT